MSMLHFPETWDSDFDRTAFRFRHEMANNPALRLDALSEIILSLPKDQVFASRADLKIDADFDRAHVDHAIDRSLEATLANMASSNSYVMVRKPDTDSRLKPVLDLFTETLTGLAQGLTASSLLGGRSSSLFHDPMLYLFISSPNSVTPFHVDRYSTLLLQLQGVKEVNIWERNDRSTVTEEELEFLFGRPYEKNPKYKLTDQRQPTAWRLEQGEGVHIPFTAPHWVKNGPEVSVSVSFIWQTPTSLRQSDAYAFNYLARRVLSKTPLPVAGLLGSVGQSPVVDTAKSGILRIGRGVRRRAQVLLKS